MSHYCSAISCEILSNSVDFFTIKLISIQRENNTRIYLIPLLPGLNEIKEEMLVTSQSIVQILVVMVASRFVFNFG